MKKKEWQILLSYIRAHIGVALFLAGSAAVFAVVLFLSGLPAEPVPAGPEDVFSPAALVTAAAAPATRHRSTVPAVSPALWYR